jgi:hypothetical protein
LRAKFIAPRAACHEYVLVGSDAALLPSPFGRRVGDEGLVAKSFSSFLYFGGGEWHSKAKSKKWIAEP